MVPKWIISLYDIQKERARLFLRKNDWSAQLGSDAWKFRTVLQTEKSLLLHNSVQWAFIHKVLVCLNMYAKWQLYL